MLEACVLEEDCYGSSGSLLVVNRVLFMNIGRLECIPCSDMTVTTPVEALGLDLDSTSVLECIGIWSTSPASRLLFAITTSITESTMHGPTVLPGANMPLQFHYNAAIDSLQAHEQQRRTRAANDLGYLVQHLSIGA